MPQDGQNTSSTTIAPMPSTTTKLTTKRTTTSPEIKPEIKRLESIQDKLFAVLGLKMACDKLRDLKYDLVVVQKEGRTTIELVLNVDFNFDNGRIGGKDVMVVQNELERQIKELRAKL